MSADAILRLLREGGSDGLRLGRSGVAELDRLARVLDQDEVVLIAPEIIGPEGGILRLRARTRLDGCDVAFRASLTAEAAGDGEAFVRLRLAAEGPQTLAQLFGPDQPKSVVADAAGHIVAVDSILGPLLVEDATLVVSSNGSQGSFTGSFAVDQPNGSYGLARYTPLPLARTVALKGAWSGPATGRSFTLFGSSTAGVTLPDFVTDYGLRLSNAYEVTGGGTTDPVSGAAFYLTSNLDGAVLTVPLLYNDGYWSADLALTEHVTLAEGADALMRLLGDGAATCLVLPPGLTLLSSFSLDHLRLGLETAGPGQMPALRMVGVTIASDATWQPPIPLLGSIGGIGAQMIYQRPVGDEPGVMMATVFGRVTLGKTPPGQIVLECSVGLPTFDIEIFQPDGETADLGAFLAATTGATLPTGWAVTLSNLRASALMAERELHAVMDLTGIVPLGDPATHPEIALTELGGRIDVSPDHTATALWAQFTIGGAGTPGAGIPFDIVAAYDTATGAWTFSGGLLAGTKAALTDMVLALTGEPAPGWLRALDLAVTDLWISYSTAENHPYGFTGGIEGNLPLSDVLGYDIAIAATAQIARASDGTTSRSLSGTFAIADVIVTATVALTDPKTWEFQVQWGGTLFDAVTVPVTDPADGKIYNVIRIGLSGVTLGDIVSDLIHMVDPYLDSRLDPPWDLLNTIDLSRARFTIDAKYSTLAVELDVGLSLGFIDVTSVAVVYDRGSPRGTITYQVQGAFLGRTYGGANPLTWDAIDGSPPDVPSKGKSLLDIHYMGLGQHVEIGPNDGTVRGALAAMREVLVPSDGRTNPIPAGAYAADVGWVAGLDLTLMGFIGLGLVFEDPSLYALHVALSGEEAKALDGLAVELIYRKISDEVGVFHIQLTLPDAYRQIELGAVSVTLGLISVDVYTDGGFEIDLGFPHGGDYSIAFTVEAGIFLGRGGLYFGVLESGGSSRVPTGTNGQFAPVIAAGVGFAGGVGRDFDEGILSAGAFVQLEAIFEGVLAWFHPTDAAQPVDMYYYCRATAGIAGQIYGSVDFGIVSASVTISVQATATLVLEAYRATLVDLDAELSVSASVHFLFFHVSFSFDMTLRLDFQIGSDATAPWQLTAGSSGDGAARADRIFARRRRGARRAMDFQRDAYLSQRRQLGESTGLHWKCGDVIVLPDGPGKIPATIVPGLTLDGVPVQWGTRTPPSAATALVDFVPATVGDAEGGDPLDVLAQTLLRWAFVAAGQPKSGGSVDLGALANLNAQMTSDETQRAFSWRALDMLFGRNLEFDFQDFTGDLVTGSVLPMPPVFQRTDGVARQPGVDYGTHTPLSEPYETALAAWLAALRVDQATAPSRSAGGPRSEAGRESFPTMMFRAYHLALTKAVVGEAAAVAGAWTARIPSGGSLADLARTFQPRAVTYVKSASDTLDTAAARFGVSVDELAFFDPGIAAIFAAAAAGAVVTFHVGVTPESIAAGNPSLPLSAGPGHPPGGTVTLDLAPLVWLTVAGDTLAAIAGGGIGGWLAEPEGIADDLLLLRSGADLIPTGFAWAGGGALAAARRDAILFVRLIDTDAVSAIDAALVAECSTRIAALNPDLSFDDRGRPVQPVARIVVPTDRGSGTASDWPVQPGDTLSRLSRAVALTIDPSSGRGFAAFAAAVDAANPVAGAPVVLPASLGTVILANESLAQLANRLLTSVTDPRFAAMIGPVPILSPGRSLVAPSSPRVVAAGTTLQQVATTYGLSLEALGARIGETEGLFADGTAVAVAHAASLPTEALIAETLRRGGARIRAQMSRFMLHGLRLPEPAADGSGLGPGLVPLAQLMGTQVPLEALRLPDGDYAAQFAFGEMGERNWISLPDDQSTTLSCRLTAADVTSHQLADVLAPAFVDPDAPVTAAPLAVALPRRWDLSQRILWLCPAWPAMLGSAPADGRSPSLWPLPDSLLAALAATPAGENLNLCRIDPNAAPGASPPDLLSRWCAGTRIDLTIRQTRAPEVYEVVAVDTDHQDLLLDLWQAVAAAQADVEIDILFQPAAAGEPTGLTSLLLGGLPTLLVQSNLSTESRRDAVAVASASVALLTDPADFLRLVWECGVVGGGGYWLRIGTAADQALPSSVFDRSGRTRLTLLVAETGPAGRTLQRVASYNNVVAIGDAVSPATSHLFLQNPDPTEERFVAAIGVGQASFVSEMASPAGHPAHRRADGGLDNDADLRTRQTFQLLGYRLAENDVFAASPIGLPIGPADPDGEGTTWQFRQVLPIHRYAKWVPTPSVDGLPPGRDNVYAGVVADRRGDPVSATVELWFQDVHGNATLGAPTDVVSPSASRLAEDGGVFSLALPSVYTDALVGPDQWPSTVADFRVTGACARPELEIGIALKLSAYSPASDQLTASLSDTIGRHRDRFAQIWYQLHQPDVTARLDSTLLIAPQAVELAPLRRFAAAAYVFLGAIGRMAGDTAAARCATLDAICAAYGLDYGDLARANAGLILGSLYAQCPIPTCVIAAAGASVEDLCGPAAAAVLSDPANGDLPLSAGVELRIKPVTFTVTEGTLSAIAKARGCSVDNLAQASATLPCLAPGLVLRAYDQSVTTGKDLASLVAVVAALRAAGAPVTLLDLARTYADQAGLVAAGVSMACDGFLIVPGQTLEDGRTGLPQATLGPLNVAVVDLFPAGTPLAGEPGVATAQDLARPITTVARSYGLTPEQLFAAWGRTPLKDPTLLALPGRAILPDEAADLRVTYAIRPGDTLESVASLFPGATALTLVDGNWALRGTLRAGVAVEIGTAVVTTGADDGFAALAARFTHLVSAAEIAAALAGKPGVLCAGASLLCPLPAAPTGGELSLQALGTRYGVAADELAVANAALAGWIAADAVFHLNGKTVPDSGRGDLSSFSLASVVGAFAQQGVATSIREVIAANLTGRVIAAGSRFLLPPPPLALSWNLPIGAAYPRAIFPLTTTLTLSRDRALVAPALLINDDAAATAVTRVPPRATASGSGSLGYLAFATALETALPELRVCAGASDAATQRAAPLWAVAGGTHGLSRLQVTATPAFLGLRPLYPQPVSRDGVVLVSPAAGGRASTQTSIRNADVEVWALAFLSDVETFLDPAHAPRINDAAGTALQSVLAAKPALATAVAAGLENMFVAGDSPARQAARRALAQDLARSLTTGWETGPMLQYAAATAAPPGQSNLRIPVVPKLATDTGASVASGARKAVITGGAVDFSEPEGFLHLDAALAAGDDPCVALDLQARIAQVEFAISAVAGTAYDTSQWLSFVHPLLDDPLPGWSVDLGRPTVPALARSYPAAPLPISQAARPDPTAPPGLAGAPYWQYQMVFSYAAAPQDQIVFGVVLNAPPPAPRTRGGEPGLFDALAHYQAARASIWNDIGGGDLASGAVAFAAQVARILPVWQSHWNDAERDRRLAQLFKVGTPPPGSPAAGTGMAFTATLRHALGIYTELVLEPDEPSAVSDGWPDIAVLADGLAHALVPLPVQAGRRVYLFPPGLTQPVGATLTYQVGLGALHVAQYQEAYGGIAVVRNRALLGLEAPPLLEDFVYRTPPVVFPHSVAPYLSFAAPFDGGPWSDQESGPLAAILAQLLTHAGSSLTTLSVEVRADQPSISPALPLRLPVVYAPKAGYPDTLVNDLAAQLATWAAQWQPPLGQWEIIVTGYSTLPDRPAEPLLSIRLLFGMEAFT